jgi:hypothetical protein
MSVSGHVAKNRVPRVLAVGAKGGGLVLFSAFQSLAVTAISPVSHACPSQCSFACPQVQTAKFAS